MQLQSVGLPVAGNPWVGASEWAFWTAWLKAVAEALVYGMFDLARLDGMVLRNVRQDYFVVAGEDADLQEQTHEG